MQIIIRNIAWAVNRHIIMISKGSRDTEDMSAVLNLKKISFVSQT